MSDEVVRQRLRQLRRESEFHSGGFDRLPVFQELVEMNPPIKILLDEIRRDPSWAIMQLLKRVNGGQPEIPEEERGKYGPVRDRCLAWGREQGFTEESCGRVSQFISPKFRWQEPPWLQVSGLLNFDGAPMIFVIDCLAGGPNDGLLVKGLTISDRSMRVIDLTNEERAFVSAQVAADWAAWAAVKADD